MQNCPSCATEVLHPVAMSWIITNLCPLRCVYCCNGFHRPDPTELTTYQRLEVVETAASLGVRRLSLVGGEPFTVKDLALLVECAWRYDIDVNITTSGVVRDRTLLERLRPVIDYVMVSIDGGKEATDRFRGTGVFDRATAFARLAREVGIPLRVCAVMSRINNTLRDIQSLAKLAQELAVNAVLLSPLELAGEAIHMADQRLPDDEVYALVERLRDLLCPMGILVKDAVPNMSERHKVYITPHGDLYVPPSVCQRGKTFGNLLHDRCLDFCGILGEEEARRHMYEFSDRLCRPRREVMRSLAPEGKVWIPPGWLTGQSPREYVPGFYIDREPVTNRALTVSRDAMDESAVADPALGIRREGASVYTTWRNCRLPTESEWQRAVAVERFQNAAPYLTGRPCSEADAVPTFRTVISGIEWVRRTAWRAGWPDSSTLEA